MTINTTKNINSAFILTRQVNDGPDGIKITLWVKAKTGAVKLQIKNELAVFFVEKIKVNEAISVLRQHNLPLVKYQNLSLKTFAQQTVSALYFSQLKDFYRARELLKNNQIKCYEDDIRPDDRYLMERHITADIDYIGENSQVCFNNTNIASPYSYLICKRAQCRKAQHPNKIELSMLSIDIECSKERELYSIGFYAQNLKTNKEFKCVLMIGEPHHDCADYIQWQSNEVELLKAFIRVLVEYDPDIIIGWNVINFDFMLLQERCDFWNINLSIGRDANTPYWRKNVNNPEHNFIEVPGRVVLDGIDLLKTATYSFSSFSLDNVAKELLGIGKEVKDVENRLKEITYNFNHDKAALASYNLEDCRLVWQIFKITNLLDFAQLRAQLTGLAIDRIGGSVAAFTNLYLPKLHRSGYVAPNMGDGASDLISPGGYVMDSIPGLYENVIVLDFKSLYPSIIRTFKIDPMGLIEGLKSKNNLLPAKAGPCEESLTAGHDDVIVGYDGAFFSRKKHFLPDIIEALWLERDKAKRIANKPLSQAIKIIMNSFYGILGSNGCRFFDPRLSGSITKRSHDILKKTSQLIESRGYQVIYGDTDSIFVAINKNKTTSQVSDLGKELEDLINDKWKRDLKDEFNIESHLEIEFETHFTKFFMPAIRGNSLATKNRNIGTKKRYAGVSNGNLIFKGLEAVRSDWTQLSKEFQQTLYQLVFNQEPVEDYIIHIVKQMKQGDFDDKLIFSKKIRRRLADYKNTPPHIKAALFANRRLLAQGEIKRYDHRSIIQYVMTIEGVQPIEFQDKNLDYDFYIEKQLKPIADDILPFMGSYFDKIVGRQIGLF